MLRPAVESDKARIRAWRNHPQVREVSNTSHIISPAEHEAWWDRVQADDGTRILIFERLGIPCGVVSFFNLDDTSGWWGYYLDNSGLEQSGTLFPAWIQIQREALRYAREVLKLRQLDAETLSSNEAAVSFNDRMGFEVVSVTDSVFDGKPVSVIHSRKIWEE